jgi:adenosylmethionine-8-amino-7-oxononanoate aminotransferase
MAGVELVADRSTKAVFPPEQKVGPRVNAEMIKRGVVTRIRGDSVFFAPPLIVTEAQVDRLIAVTRDAVKAVLGV